MVDVRIGYQFIRDNIAVNGIVSNIICCGINSNVNMAGNPDKNNLLFILDTNASTVHES